MSAPDPRRKPPASPAENEAGRETPGLDAPIVAALYVEFSESLRRFLLGVLRDSQLANDALQATFAKLVERGDDTRPESRRAWLFQVAYREALAIRRKQAVRDRVHAGNQDVAQQPDHRGRLPVTGEDLVIQVETVEAVRRAVDQLPAAQRDVVRLRIYHDMTFAQIAERLQIPLGTALGRMRAALQKLRQALAPHQNED